MFLSFEISIPFDCRLAVEYHILGRIELAGVDKEHYHGESDGNDEYEELVHKLHP